MILETERLVLRRFTAADVDPLFVLHNDPDVMRLLTGGELVSRREVEREYRERFAGHGYWVAGERVTGEFLGWFALHPTVGRDPDEVELGYRLRKAAWGRGYATEGAHALIRTGFAEMGVRCVWAQTMAVNLASRRVMEKAGLVLARVFYPAWEDPLPGAEHGEVEYTMERAAWERREAAGRKGANGGRLGVDLAPATFRTVGRSVPGRGDAEITEPRSPSNTPLPGVAHRASRGEGP